MQRILLCGLSSLRAQLLRYFARRSRRIEERDVREAISLSLARNRPDLNFGAVTASRASSFMDGSALLYPTFRASRMAFSGNLRGRPRVVWRSAIAVR